MHENPTQLRDCLQSAQCCFYLCQWGSLLPLLLLQPSWDSLWLTNLMFWLGGCVSLANHSRNQGLVDGPLYCGLRVPTQGWVQEKCSLQLKPTTVSQVIGIATGSSEMAQGKLWLGNSLSIQEIRLDRVGSGLGIKTVTKLLQTAIPQWSLLVGEWFLPHSIWGRGGWTQSP